LLVKLLKGVLVAESHLAISFPTLRDAVEGVLGKELFHPVVHLALRLLDYFDVVRLFLHRWPWRSLVGLGRGHVFVA
jgi:hypothetical protein